MKHIINKVCRLFMNLCYFFHLFNKKYLFIGTPIHGNLGDQAIAESMAIFLKDNSRHKYYEITLADYFRHRNIIYHIKPKTIVMVGGGNMGDVWPKEEDLRLDVISHFKKSKIVIFPQTIFFEKPLFSNYYYDSMIRIYNEHPKLYIFARETFSYDFLVKNFTHNHVYLCPDIVLYNKVKTRDVKSNKVLIIKRKDKESLENKNLNSIVDSLASFGYAIEYADTVIPNKVDYTERKKVIEMMFDKISDATLIITDRLHGMVFSYLNSRPTIVFPNYNHKVLGIYEWLKNNDLIYYYDNNFDLIKFMDKVNNFSINKSFKILNFDFTNLVEVIRDE